MRSDDGRCLDLKESDRRPDSLKSQNLKRVASCGARRRVVFTTTLPQRKQKTDASGVKQPRAQQRCTSTPLESLERRPKHPDSRSPRSAAPSPTVRALSCSRPDLAEEWRSPDLARTRASSQSRDLLRPRRRRRRSADSVRVEARLRDLVRVPPEGSDLLLPFLLYRPSRDPSDDESTASARQHRHAGARSRTLPHHAGLEGASLDERRENRTIAGSLRGEESVGSMGWSSKSSRTSSAEVNIGREQTTRYT